VALADAFFWMITVSGLVILADTYFRVVMLALLEEFLYEALVVLVVAFF
jgi:hypothetical protein